MFDLDVGKLVVFGVVALVVIGPDELPAALRLAGRTWARARRVRADLRSFVATALAETSLESEIADLDRMRRNLALDPTTAMRGNLPGSEPVASVAIEAMQYASPEMQAYLAPQDEPEPAPLAN